MRIGEAARRSGMTTEAIRYYESIGLIAEPMNLQAMPEIAVILP